MSCNVGLQSHSLHLHCTKYHEAICHFSTWSFHRILKHTYSSRIKFTSHSRNTHQCKVQTGVCKSALIWQKEASDKSDISRKRAKCVCHLHWRQWNIMMSYLTYLLVGWVFLHEIWPGRRAHYVNYENINNSNLDGMSLASFCQSRAEMYATSNLIVIS